ncbi:GNAT family N-acetyltransferase [Dictyobacter aurantiacus]|uniref:N-acetyltransferase domain-containing protein n=1 Tax=Dictyobacter aurantiacus TaxID=1936993 RepID=A0A401ZSA2_9CHLR|nr:GNAT family N-acetyltransferase [Dictyobacter aurantiacus]GCE09769.1 hypothetical protein KDAU_70980 [Dictyobacter aurantiacus]
MASSSIIVRPLATQEEIEQQFIWADQAFSRQPPDPDRARERSQSFLTQPDFHPRQLRGAFRDGRQLGGYAIYEWMLRMGAARIPTGCIGMVVVDPDARKQGAASALMHDAIQFAREQRHSLLLLDGIPKFYYRYGYTDVFDVTTYDIDRGAILAHSGSSHTVRQATPEDAQAIRDLYERRLGGYTGSFERSTEKQEYLQRNRFSRNTILLARSPRGTDEGYLIASHEPSAAHGIEIAADNWSAQIALMQAHVHLTDGPEAPEKHTYYFAPNSPELYNIVDRLEVPDTSKWQHPAEEWGVRTSQFHHRYAGWMGRFVHLPTLFAAMLPELEARWRRALAQWSGELHLVIGDEGVTLRIEGTKLNIIARPSSEAIIFQSSPQSFAQLVFGYRPVSWILEQHPQQLPDEARSVLSLLFPIGHSCLSFTDWF